MFRFEELEIWQLAVQYAKDCYVLALKFPSHEKFSLSDQSRRASISISNNIAEGSVGSNANFKKFINIAIGSTLESVNILNFSFEVGYIDLNSKNSMYDKAEKLIRKLRSFSASLKGE